MTHTLRRLVALEEAFEKQSYYTKALQGLSQAQAKEVEALSAKSERLTQLLREQRKKGKERDKERDKKAVPMLSEVFALEQELHAERALVADLRLRLATLEAAQTREDAQDHPSLR